MKTASVLLLATTAVLHAGTAEPVITEAPPPAWLTPIIDIRTRYEFADIDGFDGSHAWTIRERVGLKSSPWHGFSALVEGEFSQAIVDNYHGGAAGADPFDPSRSAIADPETNELNQAWLQYEGFDTTARIGRQRLILDNAAFVGNVVWRQNEQTFDAISLANQSIDGLTDTYLAHTLPVFRGMKWSNIFHAMGDSGISAGYGWEYDSVLVKKFNDHFTCIAKFAWFASEGDPFTASKPLPDATRFSIEMDYVF